MWPTTNVIEGANFELWGTMDAEATMKGRLDPGKRMYGSAAIVGGTFGKGRVFVTTVHPEYFNGTLYILRGAFRYVAQREVTFPDRHRKPRAVAVGFLATGIYGIETAETALAIDADQDMDLTPIDINGTAHRYLDHIDVLVVASDGPAKSESLKTAIAAFMRRGGKVVGFGPGADALPEGGVVCAPRKGVVEVIRRLFPVRTKPMLSCGRKGTDIGGVFPLLCTPYNEDGSLDCGTLAKEAAFVADCGAQGVIWPAAKEALTLLTPDEERRGLEAMAAALQGRDVWFAPCCPGTNTVDVLRRAAVAESLAAKFPDLKTTMLARIADDAKCDADYERQYEALATATKLPVIVQTYNGKSPMPSSKLLIDLARRHPGIYGWFKVEGTGDGIVPCMRDLVAAKPVVKTVFTGWGGRDWLYHYRRIGTRGVISQRPMYADLMETIWRTLEAGDPAADELFAKFMYLRNLDDVLPAANMRGWNLYVLKKRGVFRNLLSREAKKEGGWELHDLTLDAVQKAEIDARLAYALGTSAE
jgi:4-hydroxy-tetrahydrodipicolinate synthase